MNLRTLIARCAVDLEECGALLIKKNSDYSNDADVHSNFKELAELCRVLKVDVSKPEGCIEYSILLKIHRLMKLINSGERPSNESLHDSFVDVINYEILCETILEEKQ